MAKIRRYLRFISCLIMALLISSGMDFAQVSSHRDWQKLPGRCGSCHRGHGISGTSMLPLAEEDFCYQCHGDFLEQDRAIREGRMSAVAKAQNMRNEFLKPFRHPVELKNSPQRGFFPDNAKIYNPAQSECLDCHRGHGVSGTAFTPGAFHKRSTKREDEMEYKLCYRCHSDINQLSPAERSIRAWFDTANPSFHPVETLGKNPDMPSLKPPYTISSVINCTDCHNNSDPNGPRGPHGSDFRYLLERGYNSMDYVPEGESQYALCYKCHDRRSILANESFPLHELHVVYAQTSCFTCHASHGSQINRHLIKVNEGIDLHRVQPSRSGRLEFLDTGRFAGECFLNCHGVDHDPKRYRKD
jgi:predicted CXXCH cytochrome family protein